MRLNTHPELTKADYSRIQKALEKDNRQLISHRATFTEINKNMELNESQLEKIQLEINQKDELVETFGNQIAEINSDIDRTLNEKGQLSYIQTHGQPISK